MSNTNLPWLKSQDIFFSSQRNTAFISTPESVAFSARKINSSKTTWDLTLLFSSDTDPKIEDDLKVVEQKTYAFINKWKDRKDYLENPETLLEALDEFEEWVRLYGTGGNSGYYFWLRKHQDQNDPELKARSNKLHDVEVKLSNDIQFFMHGVAKIPAEKQKLFLEFEGLQKYRHFLERAFVESKYLLSEEVEKILTLKAKTSTGNWVQMTRQFIDREERDILTADGKTTKKSFDAIMSTLRDTNKSVRDDAAKAANEILEKHVDVAENELNSIFEDKKIEDELRKLPRPDSARHISDDIDTEVVDTLIEAVSARFDQAHRLYELKAKLRGIDKLEYHERNVPYGRIEKTYTYAEAVENIAQVFDTLDSEFGTIFNHLVESGAYDVYPYKNKANGAFCVIDKPSAPIYILLNFTGKFDDLSTIAHETGHGINDYLMSNHQNALNVGSPTSTAEVASTFMEDFVLQKALQGVNDEARLSLMIDKLDDNISSIHRQVACYKFEQELHEKFRDKGYLSKETIGELFQKHMSAYMGPFVEQSAGSQNWWVYWGHIRRFFYVYSYASGLLISKSLQNAVKNDPKFIVKVKDFLSAGSSASPKDIFMNMGIDISDKAFWNKGLDEIENLLNETIQLTKKLGKIK